MGGFIARVGASAVGITSIGGVFAFVVFLFGGDIPPWFTASQGRSIQQAQIQIAETLKKLNDAMDQKQCDDYIARLDRANSAIARNPKDASAIELKYASEETIRGIPGCMLQGR